MNTKVQPIAVATLIGIVPNLAVGLTAYPATPGFGAPSYSQAQIDAARLESRRTGHREGSAECIANPKSCGCNEVLASGNAAPLDPCGINLNTLLTGARYGETEPNENIISADPMVPNAIYWGQSMSSQDQDWFYVTTEEPNQIVNLNLRPSTNTGVNDGGSWDISIRDAAGNILANFPYTTTQSNEINVPTFVAFPGTYYVVIKTLGADATTTAANWTTIPYNLIANISFSDSDTTPIDVNFFDVETEPNDDFSTADPLVSTVTMFGMLHTTLAGNATDGWNLQSEQDWFWYKSPGNEIATIAWCQREYCEYEKGYTWRITVKMRDGTLIHSFDSADLLSNDSTAYKTVYLGLEKAGDYFIQIQSEVLTVLNTDTGLWEILTQCREWTTPQPGQTAVCLSRAPVSTTTSVQYNFTWHGTHRPPNTYDP